MKKLIWISALLVTLASCSKEQAPTEAVVEDETAATPTEVAAPAVEETDTETVALEVVEESAAVAEPEDNAIVLAQTDTGAAPQNWQFKEGVHYTRMIPTQPTVGGADKIEVAEIFMYSCPHCFDLESFLVKWAETKSPDVRFVRIPAIFNQIAQLHAQLYYTEEVLAANGKLKDQNAFRRLVFEEYHRRGNRLASEGSIQRLFARAGVSEEDFQRTWGSFEVNQKMRVAADLGRRYNIMSVPAIVVNGKYRTGGAEAGSYPKLIEVIDELTAREGLR